MVNKFIRSLLLERDDDESDEDVDEEERKDDEVDDVEDGHLHAEVGLRTLVLVRRVHRVDQHPEVPQKLLYTVYIVTYIGIVCGIAFSTVPGYRFFSFFFCIIHIFSSFLYVCVYLCTTSNNKRLQ